MPPRIVKPKVPFLQKMSSTYRGSPQPFVTSLLPQSADARTTGHPFPNITAEGFRTAGVLPSFPFDAAFPKAVKAIAIPAVQSAGARPPLTRSRPQPPKAFGLLEFSPAFRSTPPSPSPSLPETL